MNIRLILIIVIGVALGGLSFLNWQTLVSPESVSLGVTTVQAPLGLIILVLTVLLGLLFLAYILWLQGTVILENRRHNKEIATQRELADKAEASRFTELREFLTAQHGQTQAELFARIAALEAQILAKVEESDNSTAAFIGQLEDQLSQGDKPSPQAPR